MPTLLEFMSDGTTPDLHRCRFDVGDRPGWPVVDGLARFLGRPESACAEHGARCTHVTGARAHVAAWVREYRPGMSYDAVASAVGYANGGSCRHAVGRVTGAPTAPSRRTTVAEIRAQAAADAIADADGGDNLYRWGSGRRFGVEIEVDDLTLRRASAATARALGLPHVCVMGYHGRTCETCGRTYNGADRYGVWRVERDQTVSAEVVSPVLTGEAGLREAATVLKALREAGATVSNRCGMHVHVATDGMAWDRLADLVEFYAAAQDWLYSLSHISRRTSAYSQPQYNVDAAVRNLRNGVPAETGRGTLNLGKVTRTLDGTIEYRQHHGTLDRRKMRRWVQMVTVLTDLAADGTLAAWSADWQNAPVMLARLQSTGKVQAADVAHWLALVTTVERSGR